MRIAYISYEHAAGIPGGGIGTYIGQITKLMADRGHSVEVFAGTLDGSSSTISLNGYLLHLTPAKTNAEFRAQVVTIFKEQHASNPFDIIESPEYGADGMEVKKAFPTVPLTLKLHTPSFLTWKLNELKGTITDKIRFVVGGLIRLQRVNFYWTYHKQTDPEFELFNLADSVSSPSKSLAEIVSKKWGTAKNIAIIPYPFKSDYHAFKQVIIKPGNGIVVTFIGKLEKRKGIIELMKAIPLVLNSFPDTVFRFIGAPSPSPDRKVDMVTYMKRKLKRYEQSLEFLGFQPYNHIPALIADSHICIFPSLWENFPNVCLEAMAIGRAVIGTTNGGMAEIITDRVTGLLIQPRSPKAIFKAIHELIIDQDKIRAFGYEAHQTIINRYNENVIGRLTEDFYQKTIDHS